MALIVETKNPGMKCSILLIDAEQQHVTVGAGPSLPSEYNQAVEGLRIGPAVGSCGTAAFWNIPVVVENIHEDPLWKDLRGAADIAGVSACWSQPITAMNGDVLGAMALYSMEPRAPVQSQMDGLEIAARMVGLAVERDRLEEQLRHAAKMEALGVLAGGIAHDFNNLLTTILGNAELARTRLSEEIKSADNLDAVVTASLSARDLCNQMLAYAGKGSVSAETLECNALVTEIGGLLQVAMSKKATLDYDLHENPLGLRADRGQVVQVIMNLITNASEALGNDEGRILISTGTRTFTGGEHELQHMKVALAPGEYVFIRVSDTGTGMSPATRRRIFDPFYTTKTGGRGLGLAAVQGIVSGHNGAITLDSTLGKGTSFTVLLPRASLTHDALQQESVGSNSSTPGHILVVDDEPAVLAILSDTLEDAGYTITRAHDGQEAVDIFRLTGDAIDCVLLDLTMPRLDGEETFRELRKIRDDVRVIMSSGHSEQEIRSHFQDAPLAGILRKPAEMKVLLAQVAEALSKAA